jgi:hypothetical protein
MSTQGSDLMKGPDIPKAMFFHNGGKMLNVKIPFEVKGKTYQAYGDGIHDDTDALIAAVDWVVEQIRLNTSMEKTPSGMIHPSFKPESQWVIFLPKGVYLVNRPIEHSYAMVPWAIAGTSFQTRIDEVSGKTQTWGYGMVQMMIHGESMTESVIRLMNNAPGYGDPANPQPVVRICKNVGNNLEAGNELCNFTVEVGAGNPGAIGIVWSSANQGEMRDLVIRSTDPQHRGSIGLSIPVLTATGYHSNITIDGFDYGIYSSAFTPTENSFEYLFLKNQLKAGVGVSQSGLNLRKVTSVNTVPAVVTEDPAAHIVILDSKFENPAKGGEAVVAEIVEIFVRNVDISGYSDAVRGKNGRLVKPDVVKADEYVSSPPVSAGFPGQKLKSLNLEIQEVPPTPAYTEETLADVGVYGAKADGVTDDYEAIQKALNDTSKTVVYFPRWNYKISRTLEVPAHIQLIDLCYSTISSEVPVFRIAQDAPQPVTIQYGRINQGVEHACQRTLVLRRLWAGGPLYSHTVSDPERRTKLHLVNVNGFGRPKGKISDVRAWCRLINTEDRTPEGEAHFRLENSQMWVFGYKIEVVRINFDLNNSVLEVVGGAIQQTRDPNFRKNPEEMPNLPILRSVDSSFSFIGRTAGGVFYKKILEETRDGVTRNILYNDPRFPVRKGLFPHSAQMSKDQKTLSLLVGYK